MSTNSEKLAKKIRLHALEMTHLGKVLILDQYYQLLIFLQFFMEKL